MKLYLQMLPTFRFKKKEKSRIYKRTTDLENQRKLNLGSVIVTPQSRIGKMRSNPHRVGGL